MSSSGVDVGVGGEHGEHRGHVRGEHGRALGHAADDEAVAPHDGLLAVGVGGADRLGRRDARPTRHSVRPPTRSGTPLAMASIGSA